MDRKIINGENTMDNKIVKFKNQIEVKILKIVYLVIFIPVFILLIIEIIKKGFNEMWSTICIFMCFVIFFMGILFIINRFSITFDYEKKEIIHKPYFNKSKKYKFSDIKIYYCKAKTTLPNDYIYNFLYHDKVIFKISSIDYEGQTKKSVDFLKELFDENQKYIYELEKEIKIPGGKLFVITYELEEDIAFVSLPKGITIDLGYIKSKQKFYLTVYKNGDWNNQLEVVEVNKIEKIKDLLQNLINKYSV